MLVQVQIRPWSLGDSDFVMDGSQALDPRKTIFVGGVPRPLRAGDHVPCHSDIDIIACFAKLQIIAKILFAENFVSGFLPLLDWHKIEIALAKLHAYVIAVAVPEPFLMLAPNINCNISNDGAKGNGSMMSRPLP